MTDTARDIAAAVRGGTRSAVDVVTAALDRVEASQLGAFVHVDRDTSLRHASAVDARVADGDDPGPLAGVPVALKDCLCDVEAPATCGSRILEGHRPMFDAEVVRRLRAAGAVIVARTNMDEFAFGSSGENSAWGPTENPSAPGRVPGGSSSGSAAAVAAGIVPLALGTDTGGSVRQPAAFCGVVGVKPSWGRVSRRGLIAFGSSLEQIGPLAADVADAALALGVIAGPDPRDATCADLAAPDLTSALHCGAAGLRVGLVAESLDAAVVPAVVAATRRALAALVNAGATAVDVSLPHLPHAVPTYYVVACAEAASNLSRYDGVRYGIREDGDSFDAMVSRTRGVGFGAEAIRRIVLGTFVLSTGWYDRYTRRAQQVRARIREDVERAFERCDVLLMPTTPDTAFARGERVDDPRSMYVADLLTCGVNLAGVPAISVPAGVDAAGRPIGVQLVAPAFGEATMFAAAAALEAALGAAP